MTGTRTSSAAKRFRYFNRLAWLYTKAVEPCRGPARERSARRHTPSDSRQRQYGAFPQTHPAIETRTQPAIARSLQLARRNALATGLCNRERR